MWPRTARAVMLWMCCSLLALCATVQSMFCGAVVVTSFVVNCGAVLSGCCVSACADRRHYAEAYSTEVSRTDSEEDGHHSFH